MAAANTAANLSSHSSETCVATCWNCLREFDATGAVWCSHDPKLPTKTCPSCQQCFCQASERYKQEFWRRAPAAMLEELEILSRNRDRLGDILIQMDKLTTSQLLAALKEQSNRMGELSLAQVLQQQAVVSEEDMEAALRTRGEYPLIDTRGAKYSTKLVCDGNDPAAIFQYLMSLAVRRGASEVHIEPRGDGIAVKYRIDGVSFRLDPIPKRFEPEMVRKAFELFHLDPTRPQRPQRGRTIERLAEGDYDVVAQTLPTAYGTSVSLKLVDRANVIRDFASLGLTLEDRLRLMAALRQSFGLVLVSAPVLGGGNTTALSIMDFLVRAQREVVSLESPVQWTVEGARQVEVYEDGGASMNDTLRSVMSVRPDVVVVFSVPDAATALLSTQIASSVLMVCVVPAQSSAQAVSTFLDRGVPRHLLAGVLSAVTSQRLVRKICPICREPAKPPSPQTMAVAGIAPEDAARMTFFRGKGCPNCNRVGFRGRQAVFEVMTGVPEVAAGIMSGLPEEELETLARGSGMKILRERCIELVSQGLTSFEEFQALRL